MRTFNGPILMTTNCIVPPLEGASYRDRVYTTNSTGFPGWKHIPAREDGKTKDFSEIIAHAKHCAAPNEIEHGEIIGGFAHNQVLALADKVVDAVKSGAIRKFVVMAGCDGRMKNRNYYTEFAEQLPDDCVILTAGCAKYRYNKLPSRRYQRHSPRTGCRTMQRQLFTSIDRHETTGCIRVGRYQPIADRL